MKQAAWLATPLLVAIGCGASLPDDGMTKFANMLEATKAGWTLVCQPPPPEPKPAAQCDLAGAYINSAIGVYTELNDELKGDP